MSAALTKVEFNLRAKASMREFLRSKTWEEKVASIERMNQAGKLARKAMGSRPAQQRREDDLTGRR